MREKRVWARLLGLERAVVESVEIDDEGQVVVAVRPHHRERDRCGVCGRRAPGLRPRRGTAALAGAGPRHDHRPPGGRRAAGALPRARRRRLRRPLGPARLALHPRLRAAGRLAGGEHLGQRCRRADADQLAQRRAGSASGSPLEAGREVDLLAGLRRIGIDEISHRKGHRYLTVVVDHDTGRLVWAAPGRDKATVEAFFDALGEERAKRLKLVSCDMAGWIEAVLVKRCPKAKRCVDPFHVVAARHRGAGQGSPRGLERGAPPGPGRRGPPSSRAPATPSGRTPRT